ncbi:hypothetical protein E5288_WYG009330 [Bos mutus]|uniref:Uncharacterized protein n=1 Tax=Bos mutus TaxID=72004 RepID=A0A6B0S2D8_9CETA|nr:hypothetical protein [Bos mutus]
MPCPTGLIMAVFKRRERNFASKPDPRLVEQEKNWDDELWRGVLQVQTPPPASPCAPNPSPTPVHQVTNQRLMGSFLTGDEPIAFSDTEAPAPGRELVLRGLLDSTRAREPWRPSPGDQSPGDHSPGDHSPGDHTLETTALETTRWGPHPGDHSPGDHTLETSIPGDHTLVTTALGTTCWRPHPGDPSPGDHTLVTRALRTTSWTPQC